jgi:hypothetical protein
MLRYDEQKTLERERLRPKKTLNALPPLHATFQSEKTEGCGTLCKDSACRYAG